MALSAEAQTRQGDRRTLSLDLGYDFAPNPSKEAFLAPVEGLSRYCGDRKAKPPPSALMELGVKVRPKAVSGILHQTCSSSSSEVSGLGSYLSLLPFHFLVCETGKTLLNLTSLVLTRFHPESPVQGPG